MHLAQAGGGGGFMAEAGEFRLPVGAEFARHAAAHEIPAHRRGVGLQVREFRGVFGGQRIGHGGQELRHLHQRTFQAAQDGAQVLGMRGAVGLDAEHALARNACGDAADGAGGARHAADFAEQVAAVRHGGRWCEGMRDSPSPCGRGLGGGGARAIMPIAIKTPSRLPSTSRLENRTTRMLCFAHPCIAHRIAGRVDMRHAIHLDDQPRGWAVEIGDIRPKRNLPPKLQSR